MLLRWIVFAAVGSAALLAGCSTDHIVDRAAVCPPVATVSPGGTQYFELCEHPIADSLVTWRTAGPGTIHGGRYDAPLLVATPTTVVIRAFSPKSSRIPEGRAIVTLAAGSIPGADSCAGPAQSHLPEPGEYVYVDSLPEAITRVAPAYPDSARAHGVQGTVIMEALVCAKGNILDVNVIQSIPELDGAAEDAVRQWIFQPAIAGTDPVAVWVVIPVRFSLHGPAVVASYSSTTSLPRREPSAASSLQK